MSQRTSVSTVDVAHLPKATKDISDIGPEYAPIFVTFIDDDVTKVLKYRVPVLLVVLEYRQVQHVRVRRATCTEAHIAPNVFEVAPS